MRKEVHEQNRRSWNQAIRAHLTHQTLLVEFLRSGGTTLFPEERALLGDAAGSSIAHLQCGTGHEAVCFSLGGAHAVGVDISDEAIAAARHLAGALGATVQFDRADLYDWFAAAPGRFDVAYSSYGSIQWLSDLSLWARGVSEILRPGGRLVIVDFHPNALMLDDDGNFRHPYFLGDPVTMPTGVGDYVAKSGATMTRWPFTGSLEALTNTEPSVRFLWTIADIVSSIAKAGLIIEELHEYPYINGYCPSRNMVLLPGQRATWPEGSPRLPLMFSLVARAPSDAR